MKERWRDLFKKSNGKRLRQMLALLALGMTFLFIAGTMEQKPAKKNAAQDSGEEAYMPLAADAVGDYEKRLEARLEEALSKVDGVGAVKAVVKLSYQGEIELAEDVTYEKVVSEGGANADGRSSVTERREEKHVLVNGTGGIQEPIIMKQIEPKIEGVIIIAEGGENAAVKSSLTNAAGALMNLPVHKIAVLKMKQ